MTKVFKALMKKQFAAMLAALSLDKKKGEKRKKGLIVLFAVLMVYALFAGFAMMWLMAGLLCEPFVLSGLSWVYFAFMGTIATGLGCIGSVFATKSQLFEAKDNDFLLSLPIPAWLILLTRIFSLYLITLFFEGIVFLPALVKYFTVAGVAFLPLVFSLLILFILPLGTLALCALLGWAIAWITARIRAKNLLTVLFFLGFMVAYYWLIGDMNEALIYVVQNGEAVGETMKTALYPFWKMGLGATGDPLAMLIFTGIFVGAFALVYLLLSKTYLSVVAVKRGARKKVYREKEVKTTSVTWAIFKKEAFRIFKNPMIFLNTSMGTIFAVLLGVLAIFNGELFGVLTVLGVGENAVAAVLAGMLCLLAASTTVSASTVSLEGDSLWVLRSSPVPTEKIFLAKLGFHLLLAAVPAVIVGIVYCVLLKISFFTSVLVIALILAIAVLSALVGLALNLKYPNLHWTNEIAAVKQGASVVISMFGGWGISLLIVGGYFLFGKYLPTAAYLGIFLAVYLGGAFLLWRWIKTKGKTIFENL